MTDTVENGTRKKCDGKECIYYDGYWIRYYPVPEEPEVVATTTDYGLTFASSVARGNLYACQFHPEKSQRVGLSILRAFWEKVQKSEEKS